MRSFVTFLLACTLLIAMVGCGDRGSNETASGGIDRPLVIGVSVPSADHGWTGGVVWWAEEAMAMYPNVKWVYAQAKGPDEQVSQIENMMAQHKLDGMVVLAHESGPLTPVAEKVSEREIYLVNVDRGFLKPVADIFIEGDNVAFGRKSAEFIVEKLNGKGNIVVLQGIPSTVDTARVEAAQEVFDRYPDIKILAQQPGYWNQDRAYRVMTDILADPQLAAKIDAVWAQDDDMALGVEKALKESGAVRDGVWIFGGAGMKDIVKRVMEEDSMYPADITYPPSMIAVGIHLCVSNLRDGRRTFIDQFMPRHIVLDVELITPENAERFYFPESKY